jgi:hypothetical protein
MIVPPWVAHAGGWDELAWFAVPVVLAIIGVRLAERRHRARQDTDAVEADTPTAEATSPAATGDPPLQ